MSAKPFKLAMLGMWHVHADGLVRQIAAHPDEFTLLGCYDTEASPGANSEPLAERRKKWSALIPGLRFHDKPEDLLRESVDGIVVEGRVFENLRLAKMALESGRPVLLEKPAGDKFDEFRHVVDLAQRKHLRLQMLYLFRYMPAIEAMLKRARDGKLGHLYSFRGRLPKELNQYHRFREELKPYKGGMFFEMAGHLVDMAVALLGKPKCVTPFLAHHHTEPPADYVDNGVAVITFERAFAILEVPALELAPFSRRIELYGTQGACSIPHLGSGHLANKNIQPIDVYEAGARDWQRLELTAKPLQIADLREFAACVRGKKEPDFSPEHDLIVQETLLRASDMF